MKIPSAILPLAALPLFAACVSVPDAGEIAGIRADAARERVEALQERVPFAGRADCLEGELSLDAALQRALALNLSLQRETLGREIATGRIHAALQNALP